jgi:putative DNA primase/helicase
MSVKHISHFLPHATPKLPLLQVTEVKEFLQMKLPVRENILSPWLPAQGLAMIYAPRGIGKTHIALGIAYAVASQSPFLGWQPPKAHGVLYLDGEMPATLMQERLASLVKKELLAPFKLLTPDLQQDAMPDLATYKGQIMLEPFLEGIDLIIVDNISTLCRDLKENDADSWIPVQEWALKMRASGKSVLFIHHAGKGGNQRGTSKREDILDTVMLLKRSENYKAKDGAVFEVHFEKARGFLGADAEPFEAQLMTQPNGAVEWMIRPVSSSSYEQIVHLASQGYPQNEIAKQMSLHKSNVSRNIKKAQEEGRLI